MSISICVSLSLSLCAYLCIYQEIANIPQLVTRLRICPAPSWGTGLRILQPADELSEMGKPNEFDRSAMSRKSGASSLKVFDRQEHPWPTRTYGLPTWHHLHTRPVPSQGPSEVKVTTAHQQAAMMLGKSLGEFSWHQIEPVEAAVEPP